MLSQKHIPLHIDFPLKLRTAVVLLRFFLFQEFVEFEVPIYYLTEMRRIDFQNITLTLRDLFSMLYESTSS